MNEDAIDVFCHVLPPRFSQAVRVSLTRPSVMFERATQIRVMVDLQARLQLMDDFPEYQQIISLAGPPLEVLVPKKSVSLAAAANDEMTGWVAASEGRIRGFAAALPLNDPAASVIEANRAVRRLGAVGVQIYTSVLGLPLDDPRFEPILAAIAELDVPILLHPTRAMQTPDYPTEPFSKYDLWWAIGWPFETTLAMARLVLAGVFQRWPELRIIAHHAGGYMPMLAGRMGPGMELLGTRNPPELAQYAKPCLGKPPLEGCRRFLADTATFGSREAIECSKAFFSVERLLFATDMPFDPGQGPDYIRSTLAAIQSMELNVGDRRAILADNARRVFKLPD